MTARDGRIGWSFWLQWIAACLAGLAIGAGLLLATAKIVGVTPHKAVMGAVVGGAVGTLQWLVLRRHGTRAAWWVAASAIAWGIAAPAELLGGLTLSIATLAVLAGVLQGFALRGLVSRSLWWLLANIVAWSVFLGVVRVTSQLSNPGVGIGTGFALVSAITGISMVWMLRREPIRERRPQVA
jgi:hypothetical protein